MAKPQHQTPEYRRIRKELGRLLATQGQAWCAQPTCLMNSRLITPGMAWDVAHDDSGTIILGPAHERCNRSDAAIRGNRLRSKASRRARLAEKHPNSR